MLSDLIEENHKLQGIIFDYENAIQLHAQQQFTLRATPEDWILWGSIGLHPYTEDEKNTLQEKALRLETEAQKEAEGYI